MKTPLIAVVGPTSSGKSDVAVEIALRFAGEVVSADSRQVYKGLDLGTGKITEEEMQGVPHHMLDVADPQEEFTVQDYKREAEKVIQAIKKRENLPIVCGGTGFYISALLDNLDFPEVPPNSEFRKKCQEEDPAVLFDELKQRDPKRAEEVDPKNKQRVIRALEIVRYFGSVPKVIKKGSPYEKLVIGLDLPAEDIKDAIETRLLKRMEAGMVEEARELNERGLSFARMEKLGLEYRFLGLFLKGEISKPEMVQGIKNASWQYVKRQRTWFKKDGRIVWFHPKDMEKISEQVEYFLREKMDQVK
ncbi:MAG: tRNA (adenosine(37)-N6)-dimethylallyltransferase MiaA [Candidatus Paceibacterota bacterium]